MTKYHLKRHCLTFVRSSDFETLRLDQDCVSEIQDYRTPLNLFDIGRQYVRKINVSELDEKIENISDFQKFVSSIVRVDELWLIDERRKTTNPIILDHNVMTFQAYVGYFHAFGVSCVKRIVVV